MGLYEIDCPQCGKVHMWFSGNMDQRCEVCIKRKKEWDDLESELVFMMNVNSVVGDDEMVVDVKDDNYVCAKRALEMVKKLRPR